MSLEYWSEFVKKALDHSQSFGVTILNVSGDVLYMNAAARLISRGDPIASLMNPTFDTLIQLSENESFKGVFTFGNLTSMNNSYNCEAFRHDDEILILGEIDVRQLVSQNITMTRLNQEVSNLQRNLIKEKKILSVTLEKLKQLNEEKKRFLGIAAHDLRNPIGIVTMLSEVILDDVSQISKEELVRFVKSIHKSSEFALHLLDDLLDLNKIESGKLELKLVFDEYIQFVDNIVNNSRLYAQVKGIELRCHSNVKSIVMAFDSMRLTEVLNNLISNAIKYSPSFTHIDVEIECVDDEIVTSVSDCGSGIKPEELSRIFQPFATTSNKTTNNEKSVGLGLAIVKKIITTHCGTIDVESEEGRGSRFYFKLPTNLEPQTLISEVL